jgi:hypothetical protein
MLRFQQAVDQNGLPIVGAIPQSDTIDMLVFTAAGTQSDTVPTGADLVYISWTQGNLYVKVGGTSNIPSGNVTDGSGSAINPSVRWIRGATSISITADASCFVSLSYYS